MKRTVGLLSLLLLISCGTIFTGTEQAVYIHASGDASRDQIYLNGREVQGTLGKVIVDKKNRDNFVTVKRPGYHETNQYLQSEINPAAAFGDFLWLWGAPIAFAIDFYTGGIYEISPENIRIVLRKKD